MKSKLTGICLVALSLFWVSGPAAAKEPVAKLVQVEGKVQYSRNGMSWRDVRKTKYLFPGYRIKTGRTGSGKLISQLDGKSQKLGPNSEIEVKVGKIVRVAGSLSQPEEESTSIWQGLLNKFAKAQRYTTVRRGTNMGEQACDTKVRTIKSLAVSDSHPDLVWRNACPEYSYRLVIDGKSQDIPAQATAEMIRVPVGSLKVGAHSYRVEVIDNDGAVFVPRKDSEFKVLSSREEKKILGQLKKMGDDIFVQTDYLEGEELFVAAMDVYRQYFSENPDDNDMRPLLIKSYQDLKLSNLRKSEARLYNAGLEDDF
jgi:hypothetical protein